MNEDEDERRPHLTWRGRLRADAPMGGEMACWLDADGEDDATADTEPAPAT